MTSSFNANRFHLLAAFTWQFTIFYAIQMLFPIYGVYVPKWRCTTDDDSVSATIFAKNCSQYEGCERTSLEFENAYFYSSALEFDWICGSKAYLASLYSQIQFFGLMLGKTKKGNWLILNSEG